MELTRLAIAATDTAVFCRNHPEYLKHSAAFGENHLVTFRAGTVWRAVEAALRAHGPRRIYFAPVGGTGLIEYEAFLERVLLYPDGHSATTRELLEHCLPETRDEGLWERFNETVRTLYVISGCQRIKAPFPFTRLRKLSDGLPISVGYPYSCVS